MKSRVRTIVMASFLSACAPTLPDYPKVETRWLDQQWLPDQRAWYHHASQGTVTFGIPYEWFIALDQPVIGLGEVGLLSDPAYLNGFGFIPGSADEKYDHGDGLPIGFAHGPELVDPTDDSQTLRNPQTLKRVTQIGLTCAACHTGQLTYQGRGVLIDGGAALTDLGKFRTALGLSLAYTTYLPGRFDRFAARVLGPDASEGAKTVLRTQLGDLLKFGEAALALDQSVKEGSVEEGFGRLDALSRIGNQVFSIDTSMPINYAATSAPVHYPHIWGTSWFDWVQYNGSIQQPMVRNAGEAMGVRALVNLTNPKRPLFDSTVDVQTLFAMEKLIAGKEPPVLKKAFTGLTAPKWPADLLPPIDKERARKGAALYEELCQECHLPAIDTAEFWDDKYWTPTNAAGERYLIMPMIDIPRVGTDPAQAQDMEYRSIFVTDDLTKAGNAIGADIEGGSFGLALGKTVQAVVSRWYDSQPQPVPDSMRATMNGNRPNGIRALAKYKARPLDGIWATPPYLHNGSVPNLYALLSPVAERPPVFYLGSREYRPDVVGYDERPLEGGFKFDTSIRGNWNSGHEFKNGPKGGGVIGRFLEPEERKALIEYLKTL